MLSSQAFDWGRNFGILVDEVDEKNLMQPSQRQQQEFYWWYQFAFFQTFCDFFNWVNLSEISIIDISPRNVHQLLVNIPRG